MNSIKGRGATSNRDSRYSETTIEYDPIPGPAIIPVTECLPEAVKTIISRNQSPDIPFEQSINPYRGREHGCVYCYARPTHAWLDLSPGLDFETRFGHRMRGTGPFAELLHRRFELACRKNGLARGEPASTNCELFSIPPENGDQFDLFHTGAGH